MAVHIQGSCGSLINHVHVPVYVHVHVCTLKILWIDRSPLGSLTFSLLIIYSGCCSGVSTKFQGWWCRTESCWSVETHSLWHWLEPCQWSPGLCLHIQITYVYIYMYTNKTMAHIQWVRTCTCTCICSSVEIIIYMMHSRLWLGYGEMVKREKYTSIAFWLL